MARVRRRLIPFLFLLYVVAYLDRVNVGFAALDMNRDLGFSAAVYGLGSGIFFISYTLLEVPSNLMLARVGAGLWIARIMLTWGLVSAAMAFVQDATTFYVLRFLLGAAEAGFFPGIIYYLTQWFPARERARAVALFMTGTAIAGVIGGPLSSGLLLLDGAGGFKGWQWLFLVEGIRRAPRTGGLATPRPRARRRHAGCATTSAVAGRRRSPRNRQARPRRPRHLARGALPAAGSGPWPRSTSRSCWPSTA